MALNSNLHFRPRRTVLSGLLTALAATILLYSTSNSVPPDPISAPAAAFGPSEPAISPNGSRLAFSFEGDLWIVGAFGGTARKITRGSDFDRRPFWSHDGRSIAFARIRDGVQNLWILDLSDEIERQLTYHESADWPSGFTPDDRAVIFHSARSGADRIYRVSVEGGEPEALTFDLSTDGDLDRSGSRLLFTRGLVPWWRLGYRGSAAQDVYVVDLASRRSRRLTEFAGCDLWPRWEPDGSALIFATDESFARNLWRLEIKGGKRTQLTNHRDGPVEFPQISADGRWVVYAQNGTIWRVGLQPLTPARQLAIECAPESEDITLSVIDPFLRRYPPQSPELIHRPSSGATKLIPLPDGDNVLIEAYGGIFKLDLTRTMGVPGRPTAGSDSAVGDVAGSIPERGPNGRHSSESPSQEQGSNRTLRANSLGWSSFREDDATLSPDGRRVLFSSDRAGNRDLYYLDLETGSSTEHESNSPALFRSNVREEFAPLYSPDGRFVAYRRRDAGEELMLADAEGGRETVVARGVRFGKFSFSPDSRWIAYARLDEVGNWDLHLLPLFSGESQNATAHPAKDEDPRWSPDGRKLYFLSDRAGSTDVWALHLHESDAWDETVRSTLPDSSRRSADRSETKSMSPENLTEVSVDLVGLANRAVQVTSLFGDESEYALGEDGSIALISGVLGTRDLWVMDGPRSAPRHVASQGIGAHSLVYGSGFYWALDREGTILRFGVDGSTRRWRFQAMERSSRAQLYDQILGEVWRELRDGFYSPHMHLAPWEATLARYRKRLPGVHTREELQSLVLRMAGELNASHVGFGPPEVPDSLRTGELGLVLEPMDWSPRSAGSRARSDVSGREIREVVAGGPAARAGLRAGDRLLSVDGSAVGEGLSLERLLRGTVGRTVELTWSGGKTGRAVVAPVSTLLAHALAERQREGWRRELVERAGRGRVGYIRLGSIDRQSLDALERELQVTQREKEAIVIDLRDNSGGDLPEEFLRRLAMPTLVQRQPRDQRIQPAPSALWNRSIAILIGPGTGSAAEVVAAGLAEIDRVRLVGEPTYGGVIGADEIELLDGSIFRIPRIGWFTGTGDNLEGRGVAPDLFVAAEFEEESRGEDVQLSAAVRELLSVLKAAR